PTGGRYATASSNAKTVTNATDSTAVLRSGSLSLKYSRDTQWTSRSSASLRISQYRIIVVLFYRQFLRLSSEFLLIDVGKCVQGDRHRRLGWARGDEAER